MKPLLVCAAVLAAAPLSAQAPSTPVNEVATERAPLHQRAADALAVLQGTRPAQEVFAPAFLQQVSAAQLAEITRQLVVSHGTLVAIASVTPDGSASATIAIRFERAVGHGVMAIEAEAPHRITGLVLQRFETSDDSTDKVAAELRALPGVVNAWFGPLETGSPRLAINPDRRLALGSTFKLFVLSALSNAVATGDHRWDEVVPLAERSFPSGLMQEWPTGAPVTLQTLATLMLQISDNTATDQLIALLGRERVEAEFRRFAPAADGPTLPFLTSREMFVIKADPALRERYARAGTAERRRILAALPARPVPLEVVARAFAGNPLAVDTIEWFASPAELAKLLRELTRPEHARARDLLATNRSLDPVAAARWRYVGFKGGSEPGVLNLTWLLQDQAGRWHMLTVGRTNAAAPIGRETDDLAKRLLALAAP